MIILMTMMIAGNIVIVCAGTRLLSESLTH